jgi:hypothetical protein
MFEFLLQELELRMEINHLMSLIEFLTDFNAEYEQGLYSNHAIFKEPPTTKGNDDSL